MSGAGEARVMICVAAVLARTALARVLADAAGLRLVARTADPEEALRGLALQPADVLLLGVGGLGKGDGLAALPQLLRAAPGLRVLLAAEAGTEAAELAMQAMRLGAADCIGLPPAAHIDGDAGFRRELLARIRALVAPARGPSRAPSAVVLRPPPPLMPVLLAIGSSTGGPQALMAVVQALGPDMPIPVVATQHMPAQFTATLAEHISRLGALPCAEARDGERLLPGRLYLAPGDRHLLVQGTPTQLAAQLSQSPPENFCRPAVDPMLRSVARATDGRALLVMLTGMGQDGLAGARLLIEAGGGAIAQDEATSVVWGMPGAIAQAGLCNAVLPLAAIGPRVRDILRLRARQPA